MVVPKVSVIIPTYNSEKELLRAIRSVQIQDFSDYEIVICDDASTDNTVNVAKYLAAKDSRIRIIQLAKNQGAAAARNGSMQAASGKYFAFLDSDDEWLPGKLSCQVKVMESATPEVGICLTGSEITKNNRRKAYNIPLKEWEEDPLTSLVTGALSFTTPSIMIKRECIENVGLMALGLRRGQDEDLLIRIFMKYGLVTIKDVFVKIHLTTNAKNTFHHMLTKSDYMIDAYFEPLKKCRTTSIAKQFKAKLCINIICSAFREHYYIDAITYLARLFTITPLLKPRDYKSILKAFLHGLYYWHK